MSYIIVKHISQLLISYGKTYMGVPPKNILMDTLYC